MVKSNHETKLQVSSPNNIAEITFLGKFSSVHPLVVVIQKYIIGYIPEGMVVSV